MQDCSDGSDEEDCVTLCHEDEVQCNDMSCIPLSFKCNGVDDCVGKEDEYNCKFNIES